MRPSSATTTPSTPICQRWSRNASPDADRVGRLDSGHDDWSVNIAPNLGANVDEVLVCAELSDNGVDFDAVSCKTRSL